MKRLLLDIETAPHLAAVWGMFNQNVSLDTLLSSGYTLCWAAKWYGSDEVIYDSLHRNKHRVMMSNLHDLLCEADVVIHYNGRKFDIPTINKEFVGLGLKPPVPYKQVDLLETARRQFRFASNKLDYVAQYLGIGQKIKHKGFELWKGCMDNDKSSWEQMMEYNIQDVVLLEELYNRMLPWIRSHPNHGLYADVSEQPVCPSCGSRHVQRRGTARTGVGLYQRYQCKDCGTWSRSRIMDKTDRTNLIIRET